MKKRWLYCSGLGVLAAAVIFTAELPDQAETLHSWNNGAAKTAILRFVDATTDPSSANYVPPAERIAAFDQDGTLWVEHPMYTQVAYSLDRVPTVAKAKPELSTAEPFRTVLSGDRNAIARLSPGDIVKIASATLTGMNVDEYLT